MFDGPRDVGPFFLFGASVALRLDELPFSTARQIQFAVVRDFCAFVSVLVSAAATTSDYWSATPAATGTVVPRVSCR
jgi:hypothetical protein